MFKELEKEELESVAGGGTDFSGVTSAVNSAAWIVRTQPGGHGSSPARIIFDMNALFR